MRSLKTSHGLCQIDMGNLAQRMNAGIGAAGAMHGCGRAVDLRHRGLKHALHRMARRLELPADEGFAVIFDDELVARHQPTTVPAGMAKPRSSVSASMAPLPSR